MIVSPREYHAVMYHAKKRHGEVCASMVMPTPTHLYDHLFSQEDNGSAWRHLERDCPDMPKLNWQHGV